MKDLHKFIYSGQVLEFVRSCQEFCRWAEENADPADLMTFVGEGLRIIPAMYSGMVSIPSFDPVFDESNEKFVTEEEWGRIYRQSATVLGGMNEYNDVPAKEEFDTAEITLRTISEDLADIYQDIRDFLEVFRNSPEEIMNDALWECKANFSASWGEKALRVARAMHGIYISDPERDKAEEASARKNKQRDTSNWFITKRQQEFGEDNENIPE